MVLFRGARAMLVLALLITAVGCSSSNKGKIEGTKWSSEAATVKGNSLPKGALTLEFGKDGKLVYGVVGKALTGRYSLGSGDTVTFDMDQELAGRKKHAEKIKINGDKLTMTDSDGTSLDFTKVK